MAPNLSVRRVALLPASDESPVHCFSAVARRSGFDRDGRALCPASGREIRDQLAARTAGGQFLTGAEIYLPQRRRRRSVIGALRPTRGDLDVSLTIRRVT